MYTHIIIHNVNSTKIQNNSARFYILNDRTVHLTWQLSESAKYQEKISTQNN